MRSPTAVRLAAWATRVFRPWLVASVFGSALGWALLNVDTPEAPGSYAEPAPRAAVFDASAATPEPTLTFVPEPPIAPLAGLVEGAASAFPPELE
jgi:hypothetical protein